MADFIFSNDSQSTDNSNHQQNTEEPLSVIGYGCKFFHDDEKASDMNRGRFLVPWYGDVKLMIDRFDCRGYLTDLAQYEAENVPTYTLSTEERVMEEACDEERYLAMHIDIREAAIAEEEERKRAKELLRTGYGAVGFSYDESGKAATENTTVPQPSTSQKPEEPVKKEEDNEDNEPYDLPPALVIPSHITLPSTMKEGLIIERTAVFIARQGTQMEIVVKTKQADNPQFAFLAFDNVLNKFYRYYVDLIRSGRYTPRPRPPKNPHGPNEKAHENKSIHDDPYELKLPKVDISNTSYAKLIRQFKEKRANEAASSGTSTPVLPPPNAPSPVPAASSVASSEDGSQTPTSEEPSTSTPTVSTDLVATSESVEKEEPADSSTSDTNVRYEKLYYSYYHHYYTYYHAFYTRTHAGAKTPAEIVTLSSSIAASAAASAAAKAVQNPESKTVKLVSTGRPGYPPDDIRPIIDKMAEYVSRNGPDFELVVRKKDDTRFEFLDSLHPWHEYYRNKRREAELAIAQSQARKIVEAKKLAVTGDGENKAGQSSDGDTSGQTKVAISFTLKGKLGGETAPSNGGATPSTTTEQRPAPAVSVAFPKEEEEDGEIIEDEMSKEVRELMNAVASCDDMVTTDPAVQTGESKATSATSDDASTEDAVCSAEELERRLNQNKLRDKLATAARAKLSQLSRETELQAERKRKAAAFLARMQAQQEEERRAAVVEEEKQKRLLEEETEKRRQKTPPAAYAKPRRSRSRSPLSRDRRKMKHKRRKESRHKRSPSPMEVETSTRLKY